MKIIIVICALLCAIESRPLDSIDGINRDDIKNLLEKLNINPDDLLPRLANMITAPMHCDYGYQYYAGKCRRVFAFFTTPKMPHIPRLDVSDAQQSPQDDEPAVQAQQ